MQNICMTHLRIPRKGGTESWRKIEIVLSIQQNLESKHDKFLKLDRSWDWDFLILPSLPNRVAGSGWC